MADVRRPALRLVIVGHVDHGKSTLVGRLFNDTGSMPHGKVEAIRAMCERRGMAFEWAFLMDALQAERDQGVTIDTAQIWFRTPTRDTVIIDAPGHREFLKNMVTGAAAADAALLVVDVVEGLREQSRRHGYLLHLLGIRQVMVAINKMDLVGYDGRRFEDVSATVSGYLREIGVVPEFVIPVSAREGDNIAERSSNTSWYRGPTMVEALDSFQPVPALVELPLRLPVQDVYKFDARRILVGRLESGRLRVGDEVIFSPMHKTARVASIEAWPQGSRGTVAEAGDSIGITLDEPLFIERGAVASHAAQPPVETDVCRARLFWLGGTDLVVGATYTMRVHTAETLVTIQSIERVIDTTDLASAPADRVGRNAVAEVTLRSRALVAIDPYDRCPRTGRFVLVEGHTICGGGIISMDGYADQRRMLEVRATNVQRVEHGITAGQRAARNGHRGGVVWLTGLSGAGKSTLAVEAERVLFAKGYHVYVLDGDNLRFGLNVDLGFSPEDRAENIRRAGEVASLFAGAGVLVLAAFISPYRSDRARARRAAAGSFHEVYVRASLEVCEQRDPKGLYRKARTGAIKEFTGITAPYEPPADPELIVDTGETSLEESVEALVGYIKRQFTLRDER
jgi:bifunctional enzyme CysN/CysC